MDDCIGCGGKGTPKGCPVCGKGLELAKVEPDFVGNENMRSIIPEEYRDTWNSDILRRSFLHLENESGFQKYVKMMDSLSQRFDSGRLPEISAIIMSSVGMGKTHLAYSCMAQALQRGFTVSPIIDNTEYRRLNNLSTDVGLYRDYLKRNKHLPTLEEIVQADVLFMSIDPCNYKDAYLDIMSILSKRDRLGLATIIISNFTVNQITMTDFSKSFSLLTTNSGISRKKTLRRLEYFLGV